MKTKSIHIKDLSSLQREKNRLELLSEQQKSVLEDQFNHLKHNYRSMLWKSINPFNDQSSTLSQIAGIAKNSILPVILKTKVASNVDGNQSILDLAGLLALRLVQKLAKKKSTETTLDPE